jgi:hypothetical protein
MESLSVSGLGALTRMAMEKTAGNPAPSVMGR